MTNGTRLRWLIPLWLSALLACVPGCGGESSHKGDGGPDAESDASICGDGICDDDESAASCAADCGASAECGNGVVEPGEDCDEGGDVRGCVGCRFECQSDADCDDGNPCTKNAQCMRVDGIRFCADDHPPVDDGTECGDDRLCFEGVCSDVCVEDSDCEATECTGPAVCDEVGVCLYDDVPANGTACDLGDGATGICLGRECVESVCGDGFIDEAAGEECENPGVYPCSEDCKFLGECKDDEDCSDGFLCNGVELCNTESYTCEPGTPFPNGTQCGPTEICFDGECMTPECRTNADCDDANSCNGQETCDPVSFVCVPGTNVANGEVCGSGDEVCLDGQCIVPECRTDAQCNDGNACNGQETCDTANFACVAGTPPSDGTACGGGNVCFNQVCITPGCTSNGQCDDGDPCNGTESCGANFQCVPGTPLANGTACGDGMVCIAQACTAVECTSNAQCSDGNACNGTETCNLSTFTCQSGTPQADGTPCGSGNICVSGACVPEPVCGNGELEFGEQCDDGNLDNLDGCSQACRIETAFRIDDLEIVDPHTFIIEEITITLIFPGTRGCQDFTNQDVGIKLPSIAGGGSIAVPAVNRLLSEAVNPDPDTGDISLSIILISDRFSTTGTGIPATAVAANCASTTGGCTVDQILAETTYDNGVCFARLPNTMNPTWGADLNEPTVNCFQSSNVSIELSFSGITIPLQNTVVAGEWSGSPVNGVTKGVIRGFVSKAAADAVDIAEAVELGDEISGTLRLSTLLPGGSSSTLNYGGLLSVSIPACRPANTNTFELDTFNGQQGWWFYLNYTANNLDDWFTP